METKEKQLHCAACDKGFIPTKSQANHLKYGEQKKCYCSRQCRASKQNEHLRKPLSGPCPTCGEMFKSRGTAKKIFCTMACYMASPRFKKMLEENKFNIAWTRKGVSPKNWEPTIIKCLECDKEVRTKPSANKKYCSQICYRKYMSKRFDRWIASPQEIALPQAYDEFLTAPILWCLVKGCGWSGHHLSVHMNATHGVVADKFKRLAGFNLNSGIVSLPLHEALSERDNVGFAKKPNDRQKLGTGMQKERTTYKSMEGKEHRVKSYIIKNATSEKPLRICKGCRVTFRQSTVFGKAKFHSIPCRTKYYKTHRPTPMLYTLSCVVCGTEFEGSSGQRRKAEKGITICCSHGCAGSIINSTETFSYNNQYASKSV